MQAKLFAVFRLSCKIMEHALDIVWLPYISDGFLGNIGAREWS